MSKPLFVPLKTEYYEKFESGEKGEELRLYGTLDVLIAVIYVTDLKRVEG